MNSFWKPHSSFWFRNHSLQITAYASCWNKHHCMVQCMQQVSFCGGKQDDTLRRSQPWQPETWPACSQWTVALKAENDRTDWKKYIYYLQTNWRRNALWRHKWRGCIVRIMWRSISNRTVFATGNNAPQDAEYSRRKSTKMCRSGSERFWTQSACYFSYSFNSFKNWR